MFLSKWVRMLNMLPPEPKEVYEVLSFLLSGGKYNCNNLPVTFKRNVLVCADRWISKKFTDVIGH